MILKIYSENPSTKEIEKVVTVLRDGGTVVYPTDTLYGVGCDALNTRAVEKLCSLKGVDPKKSNLSIICNDLSNISEYAKVGTPIFKMMRRNLPGPFTFILPTTSSLPKIYKNKKTVGIRVPDNNIVREIVKQLGNPVLNMSVKDDSDEIEYTTDPELIHEKWEHVAEIVIDGGTGGIEPSTVVDCTSGEPVIIRQGKGVLNL
ncbi:MAG TPA: threonylcarbamoyl-AMP synthase [Porphyromonadaceae bacterium]|jgi:tRNA threonylcarbamoyl adenosine modification protein (Sua5/YciO/YrdC/YwlC family)|nr:threonylcarbamoyl-AMP synthase [Porphyromonadaceae bacterium]HBX20629.1 threonylcarbamoyl-AMP synthase [Porphyromonadaceae bacterium]HCM21469.1 threonylcarbamoyl-AMP synthase [Porphyromonadaceae bacterium]